MSINNIAKYKELDDENLAIIEESKNEIEFVKNELETIDPNNKDLVNEKRNN